MKHFLMMLANAIVFGLMTQNGLVAFVGFLSAWLFTVIGHSTGMVDCLKSSGEQFEIVRTKHKAELQHVEDEFQSRIKEIRDEAAAVYANLAK